MKKRKRLVVVAGVLMMIITPVLLLEIILRIMSWHTTYQELTGPLIDRFIPSTDYSFFNSPLPNWFLTEDPGTVRAYCHNEFCDTFRANSIGLNDKEWSLQKKKYRIACIGDSFTEGVGAGNDSSYSRILESSIDTIEVMNCGIAGSDPFFGYMLFEKKILAYKPDRLFVTINSTDITFDVIIRGGFERFVADGTTQMKKPPWWEWLYSCSYICRLYVNDYLHFNYLFLTPQENERALKEGLQKLEDCLDKFEELCLKNNIRCTFVFQPMVDEMRNKKMEATALLQYAQKKNYETLNLLDFFLQHGMTDKNVDDYYWKIDGHCNNQGYRLYAEGLKSTL